MFMANLTPFSSPTTLGKPVRVPTTGVGCLLSSVTKVATTLTQETIPTSIAPTITIVINAAYDPDEYSTTPTTP